MFDLKKKTNTLMVTFAVRLFRVSFSLQVILTPVHCLSIFLSKVVIFQFVTISLLEL